MAKYKLTITSENKWELDNARQKLKEEHYHCFCEIGDVETDEPILPVDSHAERLSFNSMKNFVEDLNTLQRRRNS